MVRPGGRHPAGLTGPRDDGRARPGGPAHRATTPTLPPTPSRRRPPTDALPPTPGERRSRTARRRPSTELLSDVLQKDGKYHSPVAARTVPHLPDPSGADSGGQPRVHGTQTRGTTGRRRSSGGTGGRYHSRPPPRGPADVPAQEHDHVTDDTTHRRTAASRPSGSRAPVGPARPRRPPGIGVRRRRGTPPTRNGRPARTRRLTTGPVGSGGGPVPPTTSRRPRRTVATVREHPSPEYH